ncbi:hypothetical protein [Erwinia billingiae]|uniref:hypothetical protein n=1 Tax=Erwinia billingiae TaxID=182337 RepID=UPI002AF6A5B3|nr:hypothetical protein [Erwinia billingiae]
MKSVTPEQLQAAKEDWKKANPGKELDANDISNQAYHTFYKKAFAASEFGTGSSLQQGIQAATAAVQGLAGGISMLQWQVQHHRIWLRLYII